MLCTFKRSRNRSVGSTPASSWPRERQCPSMNSVVPGLPRSWAKAASMTTTCLTYGKSLISSWARSITRHVWINTSPSGCHSGSWGTSINCCSSGKICSITLSCRNPSIPTEGRSASNNSFSISPQIRSEGRSLTSIDRHS